MDPILLSSPDLRVALTSWGASIFYIEQRCADGRWVRITVGDERLEDFRRNGFCFGATCGRFANRIAGGSFELDGRVYQLARNNGPNSLHGGDAAFHGREWEVGKVEKDGVAFHLVSADGDGGYPGELRVTAEYRLTSEGVLSVDYTAVTDAATVVDLTNHVYWNLGGDAQRAVGDHQVVIPGDRYLTIDADHLVTGEIVPVDGSDFDFRRGALLDERLASAHEQIRGRRGFDHSFLVAGEGLRVVARVEHAASGRWMEMRSDQPAVHLYTGGYLDDSPAWCRYAGLALEAGGLPDAPNHPEFPVSCVLRPGGIYRHRIEWRCGGE